MITLIGDVHGKYDRYRSIVEKCEYSVQLGDFGFNYSVLDSIDPSKHKVIRGNHDNYDLEFPHDLGHFGSYTLNGVSFFFIRGEYSIDKSYRIPGISWWKNEELNMAQASECIELYEKVRPNLVLSHGCPASIIPHVVTNNWKLDYSYTSKLLDQLWFIHQPRVWVFGHHHRSFCRMVNNTLFNCLNELETLDIK
jgi:predicted phosphodiesterase